MTDSSAFETNSRDRIAAIARGAAGAIPFAGGMVAEVVNAFIPAQKLDRVIDFLRALDARIEAMEQGRAVVEDRARTPEGSDLLEEGMVQASRALSPDRRILLANLTASALSDERLEYDQTKKLLSLLQSLNDSELILLAYHSEPLTNGSEWHRRLRDTHPLLLRPVSREVTAPEAERERGAFRDSYERTLTSLGLIETRQGLTSTTTLGRLLLRQITDPRVGNVPSA
jgi:hypothetical protein